MIAPIQKESRESYLQSGILGRISEYLSLFLPSRHVYFAVRKHPEKILRMVKDGFPKVKDEGVFVVEVDLRYAFREEELKRRACTSGEGLDIGASLERV